MIHDTLKGFNSSNICEKPLKQHSFVHEEIMDRLKSGNACYH